MFRLGAPKVGKLSHIASLIGDAAQLYIALSGFFTACNSGAAVAAALGWNSARGQKLFLGTE
jgi:hypothetical protein